MADTGDGGARRERLAAALRANLRRRKEVMGNPTDGAADVGNEPPDPAAPAERQR